MTNCTCLQHFEDLLVSIPLFLDHFGLVPGVELAVFLAILATLLRCFIFLFRDCEVSAGSVGVDGAVHPRRSATIYGVIEVFADFWILFHRQDELQEAVLVQVDRCRSEQIDNVLHVVLIVSVLNACDGHDYIEIQSQFVDALDESHED